MDQFFCGSILIYRSVYDPVESNMYAILSNNDAVIFDPNVDESLLHLFQEKGVKRAHVMLTHEHYDHVSGLKWLREQLENDVFCHKATAEKVKNSRHGYPYLVSFVLAQRDKQDGGHRYEEFKNSYQPYTCLADKTFEQEANFTIGDLHFHVTSTPGHSPGSACYVLNDKIVFTGDTLLRDAPTITRFPESNEKQYREIALPYLKSLPKDMIVMPGHGDPFVLSEAKTL